MTSAETKRANALELHLAGATYDAIAKAVGYASRSGAHQAVQAALKANITPEVTEAAKSELARLDAMLTGLWPKARRGDVAAVDRVLRIEERRAAVLARVAARDAENGPKKGTGLSDFEKRLAERQSSAKRPRRATSG